MKKIYLVRHAESFSNKGEIHEFTNSVRITDKGKEQAEELVELIKKPDRIIVSKFLRTIETAEPTIQKYKNSQVHLWLDIHEFDYINKDKFTNTDLNNLSDSIKEFWDKNDPVHRDGEGKETFKEFTDRVCNVILKLKELDGVNYIFTHGHFIRMFLILVKKHSNQIAEEKDVSFYKNLMNEYVEEYAKVENLITNTQIVDVTELI